jgi:hypothetical protein
MPLVCRSSAIRANTADRTAATTAVAADRVDAEKVAVAATRCMSWPRSTYCGYSNRVT